MNFLYPTFLIASVAIAIPIVIHLFNFRRFKTVYFSNLKFLKDVQKETQSQSKLKQLLILAARILATLSLVFAFAQPYIPINNKKQVTDQKAISIFIDNSFSMEAVNKNGTLLDEAKKRAKEIVSSYQPNNRFQLLTNNFEGKHQRFVTKEEFNTMLDEVKISPESHCLADILSRQKDAFETSGSLSKEAFILSDFQKSLFNPEQIKADSSIRLNLIPVNASIKNNVSIDTCWFENPVRQLEQIEKLHVIIQNHSDKPVENSSLKLFINGTQRTLSSFSVDKNSKTEAVLTFPNKEVGIQQCSVTLNDYPVTFDDVFYLSYTVSKNVTVLAIRSDEMKNDTDYLTRLFESDSLFIYKNVTESKIDYSTLSSYDFIILNELAIISSGLSQELNRFLENGGSVLVVPSAKADLASYQLFFTQNKSNFFETTDTANTKVEKINLEHSIYSDVFDKKNEIPFNMDLPKVFKHYTLSKKIASREEFLLKLLNGAPFLNVTLTGKGKLYTLAVPLKDEFSNFAKHALFVPTLYMMAINSKATPPLFYTIGKNETIETTQLVTGETVYHIKKENNSFDIIPDHRIIESKVEINVHDQIVEGGNYLLYAGSQPIMPLSFNFNRQESNLICYQPNDLKSYAEKKSLTNVYVLEPGAKNIATLLQTEEGHKLWKTGIMLALLFFAIETLLCRIR